MNGVILCINTEFAVIWCEDQGPLAFCDMTDPSNEFDLTCGDLVFFKPEQCDDLRIARTVECVVPGVAPTLAAQLRDRSHNVRDLSTRSAQIIAFDPARCAPAA